MLAVADSVVGICALYWYAPLSRAELVALNVIESEADIFGEGVVWAHFFFMMFFIFLLVYLHLNRYRYRNEGGKIHAAGWYTQLKAAYRYGFYGFRDKFGNILSREEEAALEKRATPSMVLLCDVMPLVMLIKFLDLQCDQYFNLPFIRMLLY